MKPRIKLLACNIDMLNAAIRGDEFLEKTLGSGVAQGWNSFGPEALEFARDQLKNDSGSQDWWAHFVLHIRDNKIIGNGGYKGPPDPGGNVEIGYEIAPNYRNQGYAKEMVSQLIAKAHQDARVTKILAHTLSEKNASTRVLRDNSFEPTMQINDPQEGEIWRWELAM